MFSLCALLQLLFSEFLQSHCTVLLLSFLLPFSCSSWCCCSLPCISQILHVQIATFSVLSFCRTDQKFLQWPRVFFFWRYLPRVSLAVSVTAVCKVVISESRSVSSLFLKTRCFAVSLSIPAILLNLPCPLLAFHKSLKIAVKHYYMLFWNFPCWFSPNVIELRHLWFGWNISR